MLRSHGNSKMKSNLYMRTKPSVISEEQHLARVAAPKQVNYMIDNKIRKEKLPSSSPRDRQQMYNVKKKGNVAFKARNTEKVPIPDFSKLVAAMDNEGFVKNVDFVSREKCKRIYPNTFAASENMITWIKTFCNPDAECKARIGIDMTYKVGPFFTTCLSFPHPMFVHQGRFTKTSNHFCGNGYKYWKTKGRLHVFSQST